MSAKIMVHKLRRTGRCYAAVAAFFTIVSSQNLRAEQTHQFNIEPQPLGLALIAFSEQSNKLVVAPQPLVAGKTAIALNGEMEPSQALGRLLSGTGLDFTQREDGSITIFLANGDVPAEADTVRERDVNDNREIEEMVVTATKRETSLQDTPMSITALGEDEIAKKGLVGGEYLNSVPNINYVEFTPGISALTIRGLTGGWATPDLTSTYLGEVPLSFSFSTSTLKSDAKLVDVERVEILRGPQGTLWGANSMSGLVRNIPNAPKLDQFEGHIDVGVSGLAHSNDLSNKQVGVLNIPLVEDRLALRIAAYRFDNAGYRDLVSTPYIEGAAVSTGTTVAVQEDDNPSQFTGGRATLLWRVNDQLDLTMVLGQQKEEMEGRNAFSTLNADAGGYRSVGLNEEPGYRDAAFRFTHVLLDYDLGWASLTSASTWTDHNQRLRNGSVNYSASVAWAQDSETEMQAFVQEVRLSSQLNGPVQFTAGLYYEDLDAGIHTLINWIGTQASLEALGWAGTDPFLWDVRQADSTRQVALFGEINYEISERWSTTLGARWFDYNREFTEQGLRFGGVSTSEPLEIDEQGDTLKAGIEFRPNDETLLYATWAQGFRLGRGQPVPTSAACDVDGDGRLDFTNATLTDEINSDHTENFELGARQSWLDNRLITNVSLFRVDWVDIPVLVHATSDICLEAITNNSGKARSQGLELEVLYQVTPNLEFSLGAAYNDAEFLDDQVGSKGDRLPLAPEYNGNLGLEYNFSLTGRPSFIRSDYAFSGGSYPDVTRIFPKTDSYGQWSLRAGMDFERISVQVFGKNLTGEDTIIYQDSGGVWRLSPRELGVDVKYHF